MVEYCITSVNNCLINREIICLTGYFGSTESQAALCSISCQNKIMTSYKNDEKWNSFFLSCWKIQNLQKNLWHTLLPNVCVTDLAKSSAETSIKKERNDLLSKQIWKILIIKVLISNVTPKTYGFCNSPFKLLWSFYIKTTATSWQVLHALKIISV